MITMSNMKNFLMRYKFWILTIGILWWIWYYNSLYKSNIVDVMAWKEIIQIETWSISSVLQVLGTTKIVNSQKLTFGQNGRIKKLHVKQWDYVTKWQLLAEIEDDDIVNDIQQQRLQLSNAMINYNKLFSNIKDHQVKQAQLDAERALLKSIMGEQEMQQLLLEKQESINTQQNNIQQIKDRIALNESKIDTINKDIDYTVKSEQQTLNISNADISAALQLIHNSLSSSLSNIKLLLSNIQKYMYFDTNIAPPIELSAKDTIARSRAEMSYFALKDITTQLESSNFSIPPQDYTSAKIIINQIKKLLDSALKACDDVLQVLDASIAWSHLSQWDIDMQKSTINGARSAMDSISNNLTSLDRQLASATDPDITKLSTQNNISQKKQSLQDLLNNIEEDKRSLLEAEDKLSKLYIDYDIKTKEKTNDIKLQSMNAEVARLNAISLASGPTKDERASASNLISQARVWLSKTSNRLEDYQIIALFDGEVSAMDFDVDDQVTALKEGITIEVPGSYEVNILLDQLDIVKVYPWQEATISFDAYPEIIFTGSIISIDPTPIKDQWIVSYKATILLQQSDKPIYNEMSATVDVIVDKKDNIIVVPVLAIYNSWNESFVELYNNNTISDKIVQIGINNGKMAEVIDGLNIGDIILTQKFEVEDKNISSPPEGQWPDDNPGAQMRKMEEGGAR